MATNGRGHRRPASRRVRERTGLDAERQRLVESCQGLVRNLAWGVHKGLPPHVELEDLIAFGQVGLVEAARDFDATRGSKFATYAYYRVRGAIFDGLSKLGWFSRHHYHARKYEQMANELLAVDEANAAKSAESGGDSVDESVWFQGVATTMAVVYLAARSDGEAGTDRELVDPSALSPEHAVSVDEIRRRLHELIEALPSDAGLLVRAVYYEGMSLKEAGERIGIGKAWASRLHARTLERLARSLRLVGVDAD